MARVIALPELRERFLGLGLETVSPQSPEDFADFLRKDAAKYATIIKTSGAKGE